MKKQKLTLLKPKLIYNKHNSISSSWEKKPLNYKYESNNVHFMGKIQSLFMLQHVMHSVTTRFLKVNET
jgi:hypothetical protein